MPPGSVVAGVGRVHRSIAPRAVTPGKGSAWKTSTAVSTIRRAPISRCRPLIRAMQWLATLVLDLSGLRSAVPVLSTRAGIRRADGSPRRAETPANLRSAGLFVHAQRRIPSDGLGSGRRPQPKRATARTQQHVARRRPPRGNSISRCFGGDAGRPFSSGSAPA